MMRTYEGMDLVLPYPDTWTVTEEKTDEWSESVFIESPASAFLSINRYPESAEPDVILDEAYSAMTDEYDELEREDLAFDIGDGESYGCELRFYYLDLLIVSRLMAFRIAERSLLIQIQAEDRDFEGLRPVFHAMLVAGIKSLDPDFDVDELPK